MTIRVSGYAVRFNSLTPEQQRDVITSTFTESTRAAAVIKKERKLLFLCSGLFPALVLGDGIETELLCA